jgi:hypothetical protein
MAKKTSEKYAIRVTVAAHQGDERKQTIEVLAGVLELETDEIGYILEALTESVLAKYKEDHERQTET